MIFVILIMHYCVANFSDFCLELHGIIGFYYVFLKPNLCGYG